MAEYGDEIRWACDRQRLLDGVALMVKKYGDFWPNQWEPCCDKLGQREKQEK